MHDSSRPLRVASQDDVALVVVWRQALELLDGVNGVTIAVAHTVANRFDRDAREFYMGVDTLAAAAKVSPNSARKALRALVDVGFLVKTQEGGRGPGDPDHYDAALPESLARFKNFTPKQTLPLRKRVQELNPSSARKVQHVSGALRLCNVPGSSLDSILFAVEKTGSEQFIDTARELVTSESRLLSGTRGQPAKLHKHMEGMAQAFRRPSARAALPWSISGVWKADLFLGNTDSDRWVATTVKVNPKSLEGARGLRVGIVPASHTETDAPYVDERRNLVICPLLHDGNFMEVFYEGWQIVQAFLAADAQMPSEVALPRPPMRQVAHMLVDRREFPVLDVYDALAAFAQPELLVTEEQQADVDLQRGAETEVQTVVVPEARAIRPRR